MRIGKFIIKVGTFIFCLLLPLLPASIGHANKINAALDQVANKIIYEIDRCSKQCIVVTDFFDLNGSVSKIGKFISEEILTRLARNNKINLVERKYLRKALEESELQLSGLIDEKSARKLGKFLGADAICAGTITEFQTTLKVNPRLIDTETGRIVAATITMDKSEGMQILMPEDGDSSRFPEWPKKASSKLYKKGNLLINGGFLERYDGWKRQIGDITKGSSQTEIISFPHGKSGKALHIRHKGEGYFQFSQIVFVPGPDLIFSASFQASSNEGMIIGFSGTGIVQIGLQYFDENGGKLGETVFVNYVKNPFADTPLIGVPRRNPDTYKTHYIEFSKDRFYQEYGIDIRQEIENNLLGIEPDDVRQIAVVLWCGATHPQAGSELWITDILLIVK